MAEVSPPRALSPADRIVVVRTADNRTRTGASLSFASLVRSPPAGSISANGPLSQSNRLLATQTGTETPLAAPHARARRDPEPSPDPEAKPASEQVLDPLSCQLALNLGLSSLVQPNPAACVAPAVSPLREDLQNLLSGLARRAAWGGDRRKASARIELSEGALAGATLVVHTEQRSVSVELELPSGTAALGWQQRIAERLEARGFSARVKVG